jgi:hypothetical protein
MQIKKGWSFGKKALPLPFALSLPRWRLSASASSARTTRQLGSRNSSEKQGATSKAGTRSLSSSTQIFRGNHSPFRCKFEVSDGKARHPGKTQTCRLGQPLPRRSLTANTIALLRAIILLTRGPTAPKISLWHKSIGELTAILTVFVAVLSVELHNGYLSAFTNSRLIAFVRR